MIWLAALLALGGQDVPAAVAKGTVLKEDRCTRTIKSSTYDLIEYKGDRVCYDFQAPRDFIGIWINQFEGSRYIDNVTSLDDVPLSHTAEHVWLNVDEGKWRKPFIREYGHAYRVKFRGRAALDMHRATGLMDGYGHLGGSNGLVLVDELIEMGDLGEYPRR